VWSRGERESGPIEMVGEIRDGQGTEEGELEGRRENQVGRRRGGSEREEHREDRLFPTAGSSFLFPSASTERLMGAAASLPPLCARAHMHCYTVCTHTSLYTYCVHTLACTHTCLVCIHYAHTPACTHTICTCAQHTLCMHTLYTHLYCLHTCHSVFASKCSLCTKGAPSEHLCHLHTCVHTWPSSLCVHCAHVHTYVLWYTPPPSNLRLWKEKLVAEGWGPFGEHVCSRLSLR
jgi:hypothetical protein